MHDQRPPTTGAAVRAERSAPTPDSNSSGMSPSTVVATVMSIGRTRLGRALDDCCVDIAPAAACGPRACASLERLVEVHHHDDTGLRGDAGDRDETDPHGGGEVVVEQREQPDAARHRERQTQQDEQGLRPAAQREIQQRDNQHERQREHEAHARFHLGQELVLAGPLQPIARQAVSAAPRPRPSHPPPSRRGRAAPRRCPRTRSRRAHRSHP